MEKKRTLKEDIILYSLLALLGLAIFIFLVIEGSKLIGSKAYVYIILLSCLNGFFMGNVLVKWVFDIIPSIQIKRLLNPKVLVKQISKMRNKHLKELCKALCTKSDWKKEYKRLKQINDEMDKVYLQKGVDEKE